MELVRSESGLFRLFAMFDSHTCYSALKNLEEGIDLIKHFFFRAVVLISACLFGQTSRKERE